MINVLNHRGPFDKYDTTNFKRFYTSDSSKIKTHLLRNLSPKDLNIFQDELIVGNSDKYKFNKDPSGRLFELQFDQGDHDENGYFDVMDKAADKSYYKAVRSFTISPSNLTDEKVAEDNRYSAWASRNLDGEYPSRTDKPVIRKNAAFGYDFDNERAYPQITYDIRDYHDHPEQLDYKEIPIMRKCFGEPLRKSDVKIMQDNITEIMGKECERRDAILASNPSEGIRAFTHKYHNSRVIDMMSDVCAMSATQQVEGQAYVFDKDFIESMGPDYGVLSSMVDERLGLDQRSFENSSDYALVKQNAGYRVDAVKNGIVEEFSAKEAEGYSHYGNYLKLIYAADANWKDLIEETKDLYDASEIEAKAKAGPLPPLLDLPDYDWTTIHKENEAKTRPLPPLPPYDFGDDQQENEEPFDY